MVKKRFNTNLREEKILELKSVALKEGLGANELIEKMLDIYKIVKMNDKIVSLLEMELVIERLKKE